MIATFGACSYKPRPDPGTVKCAPAGTKRCPDAYTCRLAPQPGTALCVETCWPDNAPPVNTCGSDGGLPDTLGIDGRGTDGSVLDSVGSDGVPSSDGADAAAPDGRVLDATADIVAQVDGSVDSMDAATVDPHCAGQQSGYRFCLAATIYACSSDLATATKVSNCGGTTPSCMQGTCTACSQADTRTCDQDGLLGPCKSGLETCGSDGKWGACSIQHAAVDTCTKGDDSDCNGIVNDNSACACFNGDTNTCGVALKKIGACAADQALCSNGQWKGCLATHGPDTCDTTGNDNNCNGSPNEGCACTLGQTATCQKQAGKLGTCGEQIASCSSGQWTGCTRPPSAFDQCVPGNDDMCTGVPVSDPVRQRGFVMPNAGGLGLPNSISYTVNSSGTATDNVTGLEWEGSPAAHGVTQAQAAQYCQGLTAAGGGWRLPTILELYSLVDPSVKAPDPKWAIPGMIADGYWSSNLLIGVVGGNGWYVDSDGSIASTTYGDPYSVRCVR